MNLSVREREFLKLLEDQEVLRNIVQILIADGKAAITNNKLNIVIIFLLN